MYTGSAVQLFEQDSVNIIKMWLIFFFTYLLVGLPIYQTVYML